MVNLLSSFAFASYLLSHLSAATTTVCASGCQDDNLQHAINAAKPGDTLVLKAGETYRGIFFLPWKEGNSFITIQSSMLDRLPPRGQRVTPAHARFMPVLIQQHPAAPVIGAGSSEFYAAKVDAASDTIYFTDWTNLPANEPVMCRGLGLPAPLVPYQTYYARNASRTALNLAATPNGPSIDLTSTATAFTCSTLRTAHHYRLRGLEMVTLDGKTSEYNLVTIGTGAEMTRAAVPRHIELEQVYIHGRSSRDTYQNGPRICLVLNGAYLSIKDSYIAECKKEGEEGKGIGVWQAPGPLEITNNYIEGASLNLLFGGAETAIPGHVIGDGDGVANGGVLVAHNHFSKPFYWKHQSGTGIAQPPAGACQPESFTLNTASGKLYQCSPDGQWNPAPSCADGEYFRRSDVPQNCAGGACWSCSAGVYHRIDAPFRATTYVVKGIIEAKSLRQGRILGNILENSWSTPVSIPMQVKNEGYNWNRGEDVLFQDNIVRNSSSGYHMGTIGAASFTHPNSEIRLINNLFYAIGRTTTPTLSFLRARAIFFQGACIRCSFEHNTILSGLPDAAGLLFAGDPLTDFRFANNIVHANLYGILGDGRGQHCAAIDHYAGPSAFFNNILINNTRELPNGNIGPCAKKTKYVPHNIDLFVEGSFRLKPASPYSASCTRRCDFSATDGKDLGADIDAIEAATSGVIEGLPTWASRLRLQVTPSANQSVLSYLAPEDRACSVALYTNAARTTPHPDTTSSEQQPATGQTQAQRQRRITLGANTPLQPNTDYWFLLRCRDWRIPGQFKTTRAAK